MRRFWTACDGARRVIARLDGSLLWFVRRLTRLGLGPRVAVIRGEPLTQAARRRTRDRRHA